jgi:hypothetical protein
VTCQGSGPCHLSCAPRAGLQQRTGPVQNPLLAVLSLTLLACARISAAEQAIAFKALAKVAYLVPGQGGRLRVRALPLHHPKQLRT